MTDEELARLRLLIENHRPEWWTEKLADALDEIERLQRDCGEAYQVIGVLSAPSAEDRFDTNSVQRALDNLYAAGNGEPRPHDDLLPFPDNTKEPLRADASRVTGISLEGK